MATSPKSARLVAACLCGTAFLGAEGTAQANNIDYGSLEQLFGEPVTTSATGSPQREAEVPVHMEIITADEIRRSGAVDIPGVLRHVTGIDVLQWSVGGADVGIRGYNKGFSARLLVLIDGRQVFADYYNYTPWNALPVELGAIRQIEVVKGPATALFGFNAVGGVVNIVTYNPLYDQKSSVSFTGGTQSREQGSAIVSAKIGERAALRIQAGGLRSNEFTTSTDSSVRDLQREIYRGSLVVNGIVRLSDKVSLALEASHVSAGNLAFNNFSFYERDRYFSSSLKAELTADTSAGLIQGTVYSNWLQVPTVAPAGAASDTILNGNHVTVFQLQDLFKIGPSHTFRLSAEYRHNRMGTAPVIGNAVRYDVLSAGAMWEWKMAPTMTVTNALRADYLILSREGPQSPFGLDNALWNRTITEPSFNSGLVWKASPTDTLRLEASQGIQIPSLESLGGNLVRIIFPPPIGTFTGSGTPLVKPTIVRNFELGWNKALPSLNATMQISVYHQTSEGIEGQTGGTAVSVSGDTILTQTTIGDSTADGVEIDLKGIYKENWRWGLSYTAEIINDDFRLPATATITDFEHTHPVHMIKANLGWARGRWEIDGYAQYQSSMMGLVENPPIAPALVRVNDYASVDARVGYRLTDHATIAISGQSLLRDVQTQTVGMPVERRIFGTLTYDF